jgi:hypothetical protein
MRWSLVVWNIPIARGYVLHCLRCSAIPPAFCRFLNLNYCACLPLFVTVGCILRSCSTCLPAAVGWVPVLVTVVWCDLLPAVAWLPRIAAFCYVLPRSGVRSFALRNHILCRVDLPALQTRLAFCVAAVRCVRVPVVACRLDCLCCRSPFTFASAVRCVRSRSLVPRYAPAAAALRYIYYAACTLCLFACYAVRFCLVVAL